MSPKTSILIALVMLALLAVAIWAREAHARETECSAATQRNAMAEYDFIAWMTGIPPGSPIYTLDKRQYVAAVCLHEELHGQ